MIVRIPSAIVPEHKLTSYLEHVQSSEISGYEAAPGLISVLFLQRSVVAYVELMRMSLWRSADAMQRFIEEEMSADRAKNEFDVIPFEARTSGSDMKQICTFGQMKMI